MSVVGEQFIAVDAIILLNCTAMHNRYFTSLLGSRALKELTGCSVLTS